MRNANAMEDGAGLERVRWRMLDRVFHVAERVNYRRIQSSTWQFDSKYILIASSLNSRGLKSKVSPKQLIFHVVRC